jgi:UDP-N-acetylmuramoyl-tripeptide--D-alanyl-D-alanine ligase
MTPLFTARALQQALGGRMTRPFHVTGISIDTRTLQPGDLFVALKTSTGDGHDHVAAALERGAAGALVHTTHGLPDEAPLAVVGDTLAGLTALGAFARKNFTGKVAAITGSVGKTTTKEMLRTILSASGDTHAAVASYNNHWGVPLTLARLPPEADFAVIEIGMNHPGEIAPLARLASPDVAVITNVESAHIGHMGSLEAIAAEKASIARGVLQGGCVVLPADSPHFSMLREEVGDVRVLTFGAENIFDVKTDFEGSIFTAAIGDWRLKVQLKIPGRHMVMNALAALTAASALGADLERGAKALENFSAVGGRGVHQAIKGGAATLIDESYNASSASMRAALDILRITPARRRVAILGDMLELGEHSVAEHQGLLQHVCEAADIVHACGSSMKTLYDTLPATLRGAHAQTSETLAPIVAADVRAGDVLLVKGSFGSRMRKIVQALASAGGDA